MHIIIIPPGYSRSMSFFCITHLRDELLPQSRTRGLDDSCPRSESRSSFRDLEQVQRTSTSRLILLRGAPHLTI